jgi:hypothetical protein
MRANYAPYQCKGLKQARLALHSEAYASGGDEGLAFRVFDLGAESVRASVKVSEFETGLSALRALLAVQLDVMLWLAEAYKSGCKPSLFIILPSLARTELWLVTAR